MRVLLCALLLLGSATFVLAAPASPSSGYLVGVARADITPDYPVRLTGYGNRRTESDGVAQRIWAEALAIASARGKPFLLLTVDNCGLPAHLRAEVLRRLAPHGVLKIGAYEAVASLRYYDLPPASRPRSRT